MWVDITTLDNVTPFRAVRWVSDNIPIVITGSGTDMMLFSELSGLTTDGRAWSTCAGPDWGHAATHRVGIGNCTFTCTFLQQYRKNNDTDVSVSSSNSTAGTAVHDVCRNGAGFYDSAVTIDDKTFYEVDFSTWQGYTPLYFPYANPLQKFTAGYVYVSVIDMRLDKTFKSVKASGGTFSVGVTAGDDWSATTSDNWFTLSSSSGTSGSSTIMVTVNSYSDTTSARTGTVTFTCNNDTEVLTIKQNKAKTGTGRPLYIGDTSISTVMLGNTEISAAYIGDTLVFQAGAPGGITLTPAVANVADTGGTFSLSVDSSEAWTLTMDPTYLSASTYSGVSGTSSVTITAAANTGSTDINTVITATTTNYSAETSVVIATSAVTDYSTQYLTFDISGPGVVAWTFRNASGDEQTEHLTISYSMDSGTTWTPITSTTSGSTISVQSGDKVMFKGNNGAYCSSDGYYYSSFSGTTAQFEVYGNLLSMVYGDDFANYTEIVSAFTFYSMFGYCSGLTSMEHLILPNNVLERSYSSFAIYCTSLTTPPVLPATTLADYCYSGMFTQSGLATAPALPATTLMPNCYRNMFAYCTNLTTAPVLPATTLEAACYQTMFDRCSGLTSIQCMADSLDYYTSTYMSSWVRGVSSTGTFVKNPLVPTVIYGNSAFPSGWTVIDAT